ncbi:MAG: hypothetical protein U9R39_10640 [Campylobacterota bacterium]|nr:hypothetical protein [Campylobacterota bacterium]
MKTHFYSIWILIKKLLVISSVFTLSLLVWNFVLDIPYIPIAISIYFTYCVHTVIKYHTSFYDIPYNHLKAYLRALSEYEGTVYGELVEDYPKQNITKRHFRYWWDFRDVHNLIKFTILYLNYHQPK